MASKRGIKRKDKSRVVLKKGESQRKDGTYDYRWTSRNGRRHSIYAQTLEELRIKEDAITRDEMDGIRAEARCTTLNELFEVWAQVKRGLKDNTYQNYLYVYRQFVAPDFGQSRISSIKKTDIKRFYNMLADQRGLKISTIESVHTVLHQVLTTAVEDNYLRSNPSDNVLRELKKEKEFEAVKRKALTIPEQNLFLNYLKRTPKYQHWYPIFAVMMGTGLRVGEATGLRWCDIDLKERTISVNHTLVNYDHRETEGRKGCYFNCHSPKTEAGKRMVPMIETVREAFLLEREYQKEAELKSIHWNGKREKYKAEHGDELSRLQKAIWLREKLVKSLGLASPLDKEQRMALKAERTRLEAEREALLPKLEEVKGELAELSRIRYWTRKVIPDALPRVSDGRVSVKDAMETAGNRKELEQTQENMLDGIMFETNRSVKEKSVLENKNNPKQK